MKIEIFNAVLSGDMYDDDSWIKSHISASKECILEWTNITINKLADEWNVPKISHNYDDIIGDVREDSVYGQVSEKDIHYEDSLECNRRLILEDNNTNRVFCLITKTIIDTSSKPCKENISNSVDLGLPSGLKWATCNVGASSPEQTGLYFAWGETVGYTADDVTKGVRPFDSSVYNSGPSAAISADLTLEQDAAHVHMGGKWRMPTKEEFQELIDNCDAAWTSDYNGTGVAGQVFTSKANGNSVFFPAAGRCNLSSVNYVSLLGYYWSASWNSSYGAYYLNFVSGNVLVSNYGRFFGRTVRGVCE